MLKIENTSVYGWEAAVRGMRNAMNSWEKSDSGFCDKCVVDTIDIKECPLSQYDTDSVYRDGCPVVGDNDRKLMRSLVKAGTDHSKFMRMINVTCDIVAPFYWWKEACTYRIGVTMNSCSTMHKIHAKEFTLDDFSCEYLVPGNVKLLEQIIENLNAERREFVEYDRMKHFRIENDSQIVDRKVIWWQMIQLLPSSYNQRRTVQLNYQVLRNIYHARRNHKLDEWHTFCEWIETLPYSELITGKDVQDESKHGE